MTMLNSMNVSTNTNTDTLIVENNGNQSNTNNNRKPVDLYLNIGTVVKTVDNEGKEVETFVSIPYGIDITNMPNRKVNTKDTAYNQLMNASNELLQMVRNKGLSLQDGESVELNLKVRLQKVATKPVLNSGSLLSGFSL